MDERNQRLLFSTVRQYAQKRLTGYLHDRAVSHASDLIGGLAIYIAEEVLADDMRANPVQDALDIASQFMENTADFFAKSFDDAGVKPGPRRDPRSKGTVWD